MIAQAQSRTPPSRCGGVGCEDLACRWEVSREVSLLVHLNGKWEKVSTETQEKCFKPVLFCGQDWA